MGVRPRRTLYLDLVKGATFSLYPWQMGTRGPATVRCEGAGWRVHSVLSEPVWGDWNVRMMSSGGNRIRASVWNTSKLNW